VEKTLIYLDVCCFNRPFDDQKQIRIKIETEAKLFIQGKIKSGDLNLAWSYMIDYENSVNPFMERKDTISEWKEQAVMDTIETIAIIELAKKLNAFAIKAKDALHVSCAVFLGCEFFITTDLFLIKKLANFEEIKVMSPVDFLNKFGE
jgi:hypothetical protein